MRKRRSRPKLNTAVGEGGQFFPGVQKKLAIGEPGDAFEVEADKMADTVVNGAEGGTVQKKGTEEEEVQQKPLVETISPVQKKDLQAEEEPIQKMKEEEEAVQAMEEEETIQQKASNSTLNATNGTESKLKQRNGKGSKMDASTQQQMEKGFGADFSNVNIHTGSTAEELSGNLGAQAFTHGSDVYFNKGKYNPNSKEGKHLLAHELTHTIQQKGRKDKDIQRSVITTPSENLEAEKFKGENRLELAHDGIKNFGIGSKGQYVMKLQDGLMSLGFQMPRFGADGDFGLETQSAVMKFQRTFEIALDGIVGPQTMGSLDDIYVGGLDQLKGGGKCPDVVGFNEIVQRFKQRGFFSLQNCANITVKIKVKTLSSKKNSDCQILLMRIDNAKRTKKTIKVNMQGKETSHTFNFIMQNHDRIHHLKFSTPEDCHGGSGLAEPQIRVRGTITRH